MRRSPLHIVHVEEDQLDAAYIARPFAVDQQPPAMTPKAGTPRAGARQQVAARKRHAAMAGRLDRAYAVLGGINRLIVRACARDELLREACRIAVEGGGSRVAWIAMRDPVAPEGALAAWHGSDRREVEQLVELSSHLDAPGGRGTCPSIARPEAPFVVNDIDGELAPGRRDAILARGYRALARLPVMAANEVIGTLSFLSDRTGFFDGDELKLLHELARGLGFALDHRARAERLDALAYYDPLTGLANNALLYERLAGHVASAAAAQQHVALALIDVERFKRINDTLGRVAGDLLLRQIAARLAASCDAVQLARTGADHFAMILPDAQAGAGVARVLLERLQHCFGRPFHVLGHELRITAKTGVALNPADGADAEMLYRHAEVAVRKAKASTEPLLFYDPRMSEAVAGKLALENKLRRALENNEFVLHYQPKVDLETRRIVGLEALIRWQCPERGLVAPGEFIPLMEETGLILDVGLWALRQAALDRSRWLDQGLAAPRVAVNVSAVQLRKPDFVEAVEAALGSGTEARGIDLEITESLVMEDIEGTLEKLRALRALGIELAIDDFGTGYSSLAYLARLPAQILKIDRTFIRTMIEDATGRTLVSTMISLAHSLGLAVVAEGVETQEQAAVLRQLRCDQVQGYLFGAPQPFDRITTSISSPGPRRGG